jgi:hypothetical protein
MEVMFVEKMMRSATIEDDLKKIPVKEILTVLQSA